MHGTLPCDLRGTAIIASTEVMLTAMFGPEQHDAHVSRRNNHLRHLETMAGYRRAEAHFAAKLKQYGSYAAWFAAEPGCQ